MLLRRITFPLLFVIALAGSPARAAEPSDADRATARALAEQASEALEKKDFTRAAELFGRADALVQAPTLALGFARAQVGLGKLVAAHETYQRIVREAARAEGNKAYASAVRDAEQELSMLIPRLPSVTIVVQGAEAPTVELNGVLIPSASVGVKRFVDPGDHVVRASARGYLVATSSFVAAEKASSVVEIVLVRDPAFPPIQGGQGAPTGAPTGAPPPTTEGEGEGGGGMFVAGLTLAGVGGASLIASAVTGGLFMSSKSTVDERCIDGRCDQDGIDAANRGETLALVNTVTLAGGLAVGGVGALLAILDAPSGPSDGPRAATVAAYASGPVVGLEVRFP